MLGLTEIQSIPAQDYAKLGFEKERLKSEVLSAIDEAVRFAQESSILPFQELEKLVYA